MWLQALSIITVVGAFAFTTANVMLEPRLRRLWHKRGYRMYTGLYLVWYAVSSALGGLVGKPVGTGITYITSGGETTIVVSQVVGAFTFSLLMLYASLRIVSPR